MRKRLSHEPANSDSDVSHLADGSIEPPFLIGITCGSCHIAFDPLNPPADPAHPAGRTQGRRRQPVHAHLRSARIGHVAANPRIPGIRSRAPGHVRYFGGSHRSDQQPRHHQRNHQHRAPAHVRQRSGHQVAQGRRACAADADAAELLVRARTRRQVLAAHATQTEAAVHHILKGGEDSIGALEAIQRVYFNIGSCAEQCWVNHLTDLRQLDPQQRNFGQTPFDIGQCRRDCPNFRAIEDRLPNILAFLESAETHATDLREARERELKKKNAAATYDERRLRRRSRQGVRQGCGGARARRVRGQLCALSLEPVRSRGGLVRQSRLSLLPIRAPDCEPTGWATIRRRSCPKSAPSVVARCIPIT